MDHAPFAVSVCKAYLCNAVEGAIATGFRAAKQIGRQGPP
jgi:hypothetical protein